MMEKEEEIRVERRAAREAEEQELREKIAKMEKEEEIRKEVEHQLALDAEKREIREKIAEMKLKRKLKTAKTKGSTSSTRQGQPETLPVQRPEVTVEALAEQEMLTTHYEKKLGSVNTELDQVHAHLASQRLSRSKKINNFLRSQIEAREAEVLRLNRTKADELDCLVDEHLTAAANSEHHLPAEAIIVLARAFRNEDDIHEINMSDSLSRKSNTDSHSEHSMTRSQKILSTLSPPLKELSMPIKELSMPGADHNHRKNAPETIEEEKRPE